MRYSRESALAGTRRWRYMLAAPVDVHACRYHSSNTTLCFINLTCSASYFRAQSATDASADVARFDKLLSIDSALRVIHRHKTTFNAVEIILPIQGRVWMLNGLALPRASSSGVMAMGQAWRAHIACLVHACRGIKPVLVRYCCRNENLWDANAELNSDAAGASVQVRSHVHNAASQMSCWIGCIQRAVQRFN